MELNLGHRGATRQSWREKDVRELVVRLIEGHPRATRHEIIKLFKEQMREDDDYLDAAADYVVTNSMNALEATKGRQKRSAPIIKAQAEAETKSMVQAIKSQIIMLNLEMPNGKRMRYCTGTEMGKFGAAYARIARKCKGKRVGEVMSEKEIKALLLTP